MAKPNYAFQKRQRELAKKQKKELKKQQRMGDPAPATEGIPAADPTPPPDSTGPK